MTNGSDSLWPKRWQQLAVMIESGMPTDKALRVLKGKSPNGTTNSSSENNLRRCIDLVARGNGLAESFQRYDIINGFDFALLESAEKSGVAPAGLRHIAQRRLSQLHQVSTLKANLVMPLGILIVGAFAGVFVRIASSGEHWTSATASVGFILSATLILTHLTVRLLCTDSRVWLSALWRIKLIRNHSVRYHLALEQLFYRSFLWQIESGITAQEACLRCGKLLNASSFSASTKAAADDMSNGTSVPISLNRHDLALSKRMRQVLMIANESGLYEKAIKRELQLQNAELQRQVDETYKWIPKIYYVIVLSIIGGHFMS